MNVAVDVVALPSLAARRVDNRRESAMVKSVEWTGRHLLRRRSRGCCHKGSGVGNMD